MCNAVRLDWQHAFTAFFFTFILEPAILRSRRREEKVFHNKQSFQDLNKCVSIVAGLHSIDLKTFLKPLSFLKPLFVVVKTLVSRQLVLSHLPTWETILVQGEFLFNFRQIIALTDLRFHLLSESLDCEAKVWLVRLINNYPSQLLEQIYLIMILKTCQKLNQNAKQPPLFWFTKPAISLPVSYHL